MPRFDPASGNATFDYEDEDGDAHHVWMLDAASAWNQLRAAHVDGRRRRRAVAAGQRGSRHLGRFRRLRPAASCPTSPCSPRPATPTSRARARSCGSTRTPTDGARTVTADRLGLIRDETLSHAADALCGAADRLPAGPGRADLRRRARPDWTPQILDILKRQARAGDLLRRSARMRSPIRACSTGSSPRATRSAITATPIPTSRQSRTARRRLELNATAAAGRGLYRPRHAPVPRALFRRRRADHRRRARAGAARAAARLSQSSACTSTPRTGSSPGVDGDRRQCACSEVDGRQRRTARARSSCSTTAAATARRRSRRCRGSSTRCARAAIRFVPTVAAGRPDARRR